MEEKNVSNAWTLDDVQNLHPGFSVDCVVLTYHEKTLKVLLTEFKIDGYWSLPGGFMKDNETAEEAAENLLRLRTGLKGVPLNQFHLFSDPRRTIATQNQEFIESNKLKSDVEKWLVRRFVSLGFYALVKISEVDLPIIEGEIVQWYDVNDLPKLYSDHENIVTTALQMIPSLMPIISVSEALLPEKFTMTDLRLVYEKFMNKEFDRRNFHRKILSEDLVVQLDEREKSNAYNPPFLYKMKRRIVE